jgi:mRNA cleavage and polyadenylation factor CLP1 P-loop
MYTYANVHLALEKMRVRALGSYRGSPLPPGSDTDVDPEPPRVLVLGPENSGKTTVCKILTNYAIRAGQGWTPMYVNTDPSEVCASMFCLKVLNARGKLGRMDSPGYYLCCARHCSAWHLVASQPVRLSRDISTYHPILQRASPLGLLVWPP